MDNAEMMSRLSEYVDGTLTPAERARVEQWLAEHPEGQRAVVELAQVKHQAAGLSMRAVPEAVWAGVRAGIRAERESGTAGQQVRRRVSFSMSQLAAAASVLLAVGAVGTWLAVRDHGSVAPPVVTQPPVAVLHPTDTTVGATPLVPDHSVAAAPVRQERLIANTIRADQSYDHAIEDLQHVVTENRARLSPATVKVIEQSLARIDAALARAKRALKQDPRNTYLNDHVTEMRQRKLELLQRTAGLVSAS
ncbi:MAG TPA: zf-HC2 domain-containing protein [Gemmatimonadales bacterium]|nr:zf-HC2 domain-containing protein [Gemmatimonadales bacterium]